MSAPEKSVRAVEESLGCVPRETAANDWFCGEHDYATDWTDRGCPVAVAAADAAVDALELMWAHAALPARQDTHVPAPRNAVQWAARRLVGPWEPDDTIYESRSS